MNKRQMGKMSMLQKMTLFFFDHKLFTTFLAVALVIFGSLAYAVLLKREGFPAMNIPFATSQIMYAPMDPARADSEIAKPMSEYILKQDGVKTVSSQASANFTALAIEYTDGTNSESRTADIKRRLESEGLIPKNVKFDMKPASVGWTEEGDDMVLSLHNLKQPDRPTLDLIAEAKDAAKFIEDKKLPLVEKTSIINPVQEAQIPTGETITTQTKFERYGERRNGKTVFYSAVALGVKGVDGSDKLDLDKQIEEAVNSYNQANKDSGYSLAISASNAPMINEQISELQKTLLEGLLAVLIVGSIVITFRSSLITVLSMFFIIFVTFAVLYIFDYTMNTIVLFSLILALALIVDDTIIMTEAIDKERRRQKDKRRVVSMAVRRVARAMIAATVTAALCFAPLLFVGGVIGEFVVAVPVTIITALLVSLLASLIIIPLLARYIMLSPKQMAVKKDSASLKVERAIAKFISQPMLWSRNSRNRQVVAGLIALVISGVFIAGGVSFFKHVPFNIFPPTKDANELAVTLTFPRGTTIEQAEATTDRATDRIASVIGEDFVKAANYGMANSTSAWFEVYLTPYGKRGPTAHEYVGKLEKSFSDFEGATLSARTIDIGPPPASFEARVKTGDTEKSRADAKKLADDIAAFLGSSDIMRADGSQVKFDRISTQDLSVFVRSNAEAYVSVVANFESDDTSELVNVTKAAVEKEFDSSKLKNYGLDEDALTFSFGMEEGNQDSFRALLLALPVLLLVIYFVLAVEFRGFLQPLLIFMAIPFSFFGITLGLYLTDNAFSFFAMLGFFALVGLSIKNTILLTDYANQARAEGKHPIDAIHDALAERFRPLIATSLTAVVSLVPLAITSPFWQGLSVVLIGGLLSSTLLVITVFPYYYLAGEYLRSVPGRIARRVRK